MNDKKRLLFSNLDQSMKKRLSRFLILLYLFQIPLPALQGLTFSDTQEVLAKKLVIETEKSSEVSSVIQVSKGCGSGLSLVASVLAMAWLSEEVSATIRHVGAGQTYTTIGSAVSALVNGDTIYIHNGTYSGTSNRGLTLTAKRRIWIIGENMDNTIMDCGSATYAFCIYGSGVACDSIYFRNFTIKNTNHWNAAVYGGGSPVTNSHVNFTLMKFENCKNTGSYYGGGAINFTYLRRQCFIDSCYFLADSSTYQLNYNAGAIVSRADGSTGLTCTLYVKNTLFLNCYSHTYGGAICFYGDRCIISRSKFRSNRADSASGGAIYFSSTAGTVSSALENQVDFIGNTAVSNPQHMTVSGTSGSANYCYWDDGGAPTNPGDANFAITQYITSEMDSLPNWYFPQVYGVYTSRLKSGINEYSIGTLSDIPVTVLTVTGSGPWAVTFSGTPVTGRIFSKDCFTDAGGHKWKIESVVSSSEITVTNSEYVAYGSPAPVVGVGTIGRWFSTLQGWEDARDGNLVRDQRLEKGICYDDGILTGNLVIEGSTTNASYYMWVSVDSAESHRGGRTSGVLLDPATADVPVRLNDAYTVFEGFRLTDWGSSSGSVVGISIGASDCIVRRNVIYGDVSGNGGAAISFPQNNALIYNNLVFNTTGNGISDATGSGSGKRLYNNTIYNTAAGTYGIYSTNGSGTVLKNNIALSCGASCFSGSFSSATYNMSSDGTASGTGSLINKAAAVQFVSTVSGSEDLHLQTGSDGIDNGDSVGLSVFYTGDIDAAFREYNAWDMGADEYVSLLFSRTDSTASSVTFHYYGIASLGSDVDSAYIWVSALASYSGEPSVKVAKAELSGAITVPGLTESAPYYIIAKPHTTGGLFTSDSTLDSMRTQINNAVTFDLFKDSYAGIFKIGWADKTLGSAVDSVRIFYRTTGYETDPFSGSVSQEDTVISRAVFLGMDTLFLTDLVTPNTMSVNLTLIDHADNRSFRSPVAYQAQLSVDFTYPGNPLTFKNYGLDTIQVNYTLEDHCAELSGDDLGIDSIFIFAVTDSLDLVNDYYRDYTPQDTLLLSDIVGNCSDIKSFSGLLPETRYYFGVATKNSAGNWSKAVNVSTFYYTRPLNPLHIAVLETPAKGDSSIQVTVHNAAALAAGVDTVQVYQSTIYVTNPLNTPILRLSASALLVDSVFILTGQSGLQKYCFTVACGMTANSDNSTRWSFIDTRSVVGNGDTVRTANYSAPINTATLTINSVTDTTVFYTLGNGAGLPVHAESVFTYIALDSTGLATHYKTLSAWRDTTRYADTWGPLSIDTLTPGGVYWLGVTLKSSEGIWSNTVNIKKIVASVSNPVTLTLSRLSTTSDSIVVHFNNLGSVTPLATHLHLFCQIGTYVTDSSLSPVVPGMDYTLPFPVQDTIGFPSGTNARYYWSVSPGYTGNWAGISGQNEAVIFVDNIKPVNILDFSYTDTTSTSFNITVLNGAGLSGDVESVWVYVNTDSTLLANTYQTGSTAKSVVSKSQLGNIVLSGLNEATRYFVGVAVRDTLGNWSDVVKIRRSFTDLENPLKATVAESGTSRVLNVTFHHLLSLHSKVDTVRLFYSTNGNLIRFMTPSGTPTVEYRKVLVQADSTVPISGVQSQTWYYFTVNERYYEEGVHYGPLSSANIDSFFTGDYDEPLNIRDSITATTTNTLSFRLLSPSLLEADIKSVYLFYDTVPSNMVTNFRSLSAWDTLTRAEAVASGVMTISGLLDAHKYHVGVAVEDSAGNWNTSGNLTLDSGWTKISNPLSVNLYVSASDNRNILVTLSGLSALSPNVDSLRLFHGLSLVTDPFLRAPDTVVNRHLLTGDRDTVVIRVADAYSAFEYFSVSPGLKDAAKNQVLYGAIPPAATDSLMMDTDEPVNGLVLVRRDSTLTSVQLEVQNYNPLWGKDINDIYFWVRESTLVGQGDSNYLLINYMAMAPDLIFPLGSLIFNWPEISGLDTGKTYFIGCAPRDTNGNYSPTLAVIRMHTVALPRNPLHLSGTAPYYSVANIRIDSLNRLSAEVNRSQIRLFYNTTACNLDPYAASGYVTLNLSTASSDTTVIIGGLIQNTKYYFSIAVCNTKGNYSSIVEPTNTCTLRTPVALDTVAPNGQGLTFAVDSVRVINPLRELHYVVRGLNTLTGRDRIRSVLRIYWSDDSLYKNFSNPGLGVEFSDLSLSAFPADTLEGSVYDLIPGALWNRQGRPYYFTTCVRDSAFNWDSLHIKSDTGYTRADTVRPVNDSIGYAVSQSGFDTLMVQWDKGFFNRIPVSFRDTVPGIGLWIYPDTITQRRVDSAAPAIYIDSSAGLTLRYALLHHNARYHVALSPINTIGNRGAIRSGTSYFGLTVPFDSSTISAPPNLCSLWVARVFSAPGSLQVGMTISNYQYTDMVNGITVPITSVVVRYKGGSLPPSGITDGFPAAIFPVSSGQMSGNTFIANLPLDSNLTFAAFTVNSLSTAYPLNRSSGTAAKAIRTVHTRDYPENDLIIDDLHAIGGGGGSALCSLIVNWRWNGPVSTLPAGVKILYSLYATSADTPKVYNDPAFDSLPLQPGALSGRDTIASGLVLNRNYQVALFVYSTDSVFSKNYVGRTILTPMGNDTSKPPQLPIDLEAVPVDAKTLKLTWSVDSTTLAGIQAGENHTLRLGYGYSNVSWDEFIHPASVNPFDSAVSAALVSHSGELYFDVEPGVNYFFAMSLVDSAGNAAVVDADHSLALGRTTVPSLDSADLSVNVLSDYLMTLDWHAALNNGNFRLDPAVQFVTVVLQASGYLETGLPTKDSLSSNRLYLSTRTDVASGALSINTLALSDTTYYLTVFTSLLDYGQMSEPLFAGAYHYSLDDPWLEGLSLTQVNDSAARLVFVPRDTTEDSVRILTLYGVNSASADRKIPKTVTDSRYLTLDTALLPVNQPCTAYVRLNVQDPEIRKLDNSDTGRLLLRFLVSDRMPATQTLSDTSYSISMGVDRKAPSTVSFRLGYRRLTQTMSCTTTASGVGDLSTLIWGVRSDSLLDTLAYGAAGSRTTFSNTGSNSVFVRFLDGYGNYHDTAWADFSVLVEGMDSLYQRTFTEKLPYTVDNGSVKITVIKNSFQTLPGILQSSYLHVGLSQTALIPASFKTKGFERVQPLSYWFLTEMTGSSLVELYQNGLNISLRFDSTYDSTLKLFRLYPDGSLEYLGGQADTSGYVTLSGFTSPIWRSSSTAIPSSNDTVRFVVAKDMRTPVIYFNRTGLRYRRTATDTSAYAILSVSDNNVYLDAALRVFTFNADTLFPLFDTATVRLNSGKRGSVKTTPDTMVVCTLDVSDKVKSAFGKVDSTGLFMSFKVSDGKTKYYFYSDSVSKESVSGTYSGLKNWQIVSITAELKEKKDIVQNLSSVHGIYDPARYRLYALIGDRFIEYSKGRSEFEAQAGRSFLLIAHSEKEIAFKTGRANASFIKNNTNGSGFVLATGGSSGGWRLVSLPFMGSIRQSSIVTASYSAPGANRVSLNERMWKLENGAFKKDTATYTAYKSSPGYGQGFLTYLYPGDTLVVPITEDANFMAKRAPKRAARALVSPEQGEWMVNLSLNELVSGASRCVDDFNGFGFTRADYLLPDLVMPGMQYEAGFVENRVLMSYAGKKKTENGRVWTLNVRKNSGLKSDMELRFSDLMQVPEGTLVYVDDPLRGYSVDVKKEPGLYRFDMEGHDEQLFHVVAGDSAFVLSRVNRPLPETFSLKGNFPNPFNPVTSIIYQIPDFTKGRWVSKTRLTMDVYNIAGQKVVRLLDGTARPGCRKVTWNGCDLSGKTVSSGIYIYQISVQDEKGKLRYHSARRMSLIK